MGEKIIVRQNHLFQTEILAADPHEPESDVLEPVGAIYELTPYGMLMAGLGSCTAIVLHTYAQHHDVDLHEVELHLEYDRNFAQDCQDCESPQAYEELIEQKIALHGDLTPADKKKLLVISHHCPIHQMLRQGITVNSRLVKE